MSVPSPPPASPPPSFSPAEQEAFYDRSIAPVLMELRDLCADRGLAFLALVDYDGLGSVGHTVFLPPHGAGPAVISHANAIAKLWHPGGAYNFDAFAMAVMKEARSKGHSSVILTQLGVPAVPVPAAKEV